jgi:hypothetical protein
MYSPLAPAFEQSSPVRGTDRFWLKVLKTVERMQRVDNNEATMIALQRKSVKYRQKIDKIHTIHGRAT